ncbi:MAG: Ig-like domain-containing protein [Clostridia bacterium]|nr:Ig-like domain-containing protein [Clostridia bacterium]
MFTIPQTTCRRCQRQYSILRNRCPHCGTRRVHEGSRTQSTTAEAQQNARRGNPNDKWQLIFAAILLAAVIIAVIALVSISLKPEEPAPTPSPSMEVTPPPPTASPTPTPEPTPTVESITVAFLGEEVTGFTLRVTDPDLQLTATVYPVSENAVVRWRSADETVITVTDQGLVTAVGPGTTYLIVECGAIAKELPVIVPNPG